ncbi:MAG: hypothetical protein LH472_13870 [Pyrinomonadaceae bacterium]|nr:hypothetical protein [Pyrinomonadaceae bacterium]
MNKGNKNNSIIFLTTLSVYLGLVLVGGAMSPVLAQAALARNFDVQDEVEVKDDLDDKPDGNPNFQGINLSKVLIDFLTDLQKLKTDAPNIYQQEKLFYARRKRIVYADNSLGLKPSSAFAEPSKLDNSFRNFFNSLDNEQLRKLADFLQEPLNEEFSKHISFELYSALDIDAKLLINLKKNSSESASLLTDQLNLEFQFRANKARQKFVRQVYENTKAISANTQVTIVTRLPRGSLDELLKQNAKADNR